jgi:hypothetical protein
LSPDERLYFPAGEPFSAEDAARLHEIRDAVEELRGLKLNGEVAEALVSRDDLRAYYDQALERASEQSRREQDASTLAYRLLRMLGPEDNIEEVTAASRADLAIGFYLPYENRLVVIGDLAAGSLSEESTIAHEYVHALQDAEFGIAAFRADFVDVEHAEYSTTTSCVLEGDASVTQYLYLQEVYGPSWYSLYLDEFDDETAGESFETAAAAVPQAMLRYFYFSYTECADFLFDIWFEDGWEGVDRLYEVPPATTEQVLHPEKYRDGEPPLKVEAAELTRALGPGWRPQDRTVFGEFDVYNYLLTANLSDASAAFAAAGWGGGSMSVYTRGLAPDQDVVLHIALAWDTPEDYDQFEDAFDTALGLFRYDERDVAPAEWRWSSDGEYGHALWNPDSQRVDLLYSTEEAALLRALEALDSS